jgi:probable rRNA maturation factor
VIAFPLWAEGEVVTGDVCIGVEQALRQASALGIDAVEELVRLAVHGTLHVLGWDHPESAGREGSEMWALQERIVAQVMSE